VKTTMPEIKIIDLTACANLYQKGVEQAVETSKSSLKLAIQQNAEIIAAIKNALKGTSLPGLFVLDLAAQAFQGYITVQVKLMDLALQQSNATINAAVKAVQTQQTEIDVTVIEASLERSIAAQYTVLDFTAEQSKALSDSLKQQLNGTAAEGLAESMQRSFDTVLGMQKDALNLAVKPLKAAVARA